MLIFTETWLHANVFDSEILPPEHYKIVRKDRNFEATNKTKGGGVLLASRCTFKFHQIDLDDLLNLVPLIDVLGCKFTISNFHFNIFVIYMPPSITAVEMELFLESLEQLTINMTNLMIIGDFNVPFMNVENAKSSTLQSFINFNNIDQVNKISNMYGGMLDLVLSNIPCSVALDVPLVVMDNYHPPLNISVNVKKQLDVKFPQSKNKIRNYKKADYQGLYLALCTVNWSLLNECTDPNVACEMLYSILNELLDQYIPLHKNRSFKYPIWYTQPLIQNIKLKNHYHTLMKKYNFEYYRNKFQNLRSLVKQQIKESFQCYLNSVQNKIQSDSKAFWSFIKNKRCTTRIPGKMCYGNQYFDDPQSIVNCFADYFSSVYSPSNCLNVNNLFNYAPNISIKEISENDVLKSLKRLKNSFTSGHDMIPSFLVRDCAPVLSSPLFLIFKLILKTGVFPECWKLTKICPVLKTGKSDIVSNYRPIALIPNFAKVFEMCIYDQIYSVAKVYLSPKQHGFMQNRSTFTNLALFSQYTAEALDSKSQVDVVYTDFSKAFDRLDHATLIKKLILFGFSESLVNLLISYLRNRQQFVCYSGHQSRTFFASSGVPQGSNLGPLLFSIFINDLPSILTSENLLFADDLKIYRKINAVTDCVLLQNDLVRLESWCNENKLYLNISKCKVCSFTLKINVILFDYTLNDSILERCNNIKDLGVHFDSKFSFTDHITIICKSAIRSLGFIIRNCNSFKNILALKSLYISLVRSKLDYCSLVWYPIYEIHHKALESVQRKFLKFLAFRVDGTYPMRGCDHLVLLNRFDMKSLKLRWNVFSLSFLYKLFNNKIDSPDLLSMIPIHLPRLNLRNTFYFYLFARTNVLKKSPIFIMCGNFNEIANHCDINFDNLKTIIDFYCLNNSNIL